MSSGKKNHPTKSKVITIEDNDASNGQPKVVKQEPEDHSNMSNAELLKKIADLEQSLLKKDKNIAELQQNLVKKDKKVENACRIAGEAQSRVEFLEKLVDQKDAVLDGGKKMEELEKSVTDLTKEVESRGDRINELSSKLKKSEEQIESLVNQQETMGENKHLIWLAVYKEAKELIKEVAELKTELKEERKRSNEKEAELSTELKEERKKSSDVMRRLQQQQQQQQPPAANGIPAEELAVPNEIDGMGNADFAMDNSIVDLPSNNDMHDLRNDSQETGGGSGGKRRSLRNTTKPVKNSDSKEDSDEDGGPPVKKSKSESGKKGEIMTPKCVLCEKYPKTAIGYGLHLRDCHHSTTLKENGIYLICSCGYQMVSYHNPKHKACDGRRFTLHKLDEK